MALPEERPDGLDSPWAVRVIKLMSRSQVRVFKLTRGHVGNKWRIGAGWKKPVPTLLLTHVGRKSGKEFETPLLYLAGRARPRGRRVARRAAEEPAVVRQPAGSPGHGRQPKGQWHRPVRARTVSPDERAALWPRLVDLYADFAKYQKWTDREIPVVVLEPR